MTDVLLAEIMTCLKFELALSYLEGLVGQLGYNLLTFLGLLQCRCQS